MRERGREREGKDRANGRYAVANDECAFIGPHLSRAVLACTIRATDGGVRNGGGSDGSCGRKKYERRERMRMRRKEGAGGEAEDDHERENLREDNREV